ncbi:hypothetical protein EXU57_06685 [Segetibacter sp. 3557_3]|uniref:TylF/MycF/NovP-related O-methyltransferase n=1 Tax=Segetibacter sp. 3557_3 TaxID=2547429 RepID=UPI001058D1DD|nr:TylF/MycF/NovP-related O-methyltransferase [Segetibacter sp. 3557_3]TDH27271.1 hypothetical protein EXU57_06685 [Segetibacter sp. 3557_3]
MKTLSKSLVHSAFQVFSKFRTNKFSSFFISLGYLIQSEGYYNKSKSKQLDWDRIDLHKYLVSEKVGANKEIVFLEFGVFWGETFFIWVGGNKNEHSRFVGFDTFVGLPEDWGSVKKGSFSAKGKVPNIDDSRVDFRVGLIHETLPQYVGNLQKHQAKIIHIDVDLYNATLITLIHLHPYLNKGDLIIFDDFFTITKTRHEYRAFTDYLLLHKTPYQPLFSTRNGQHVIEIL